jgi:glycosyltransferase involved in cell wall biosynthesis
MRILLLNPFHGGSHAAVAEGYARHSRHEITLLRLSIAGGWRWRMRGAAVTLARMLRDSRLDTRDRRYETQLAPVSGLQSQVSGPRSQVSGSGSRFDLILATDMLDLATFLGLTRDITSGVPVGLYMHENQLTYPLPAGRARDLAFPWINYTSLLAADAIFFNSEFHRRALLDALPGLLGRYHDHQELDLVDTIAAKASVLPPGIDLARLDDFRLSILDVGFEENSKSPIPNPQSPVILWNSRWEYDKAPEAFFAALRELETREVDFRVIVAGEHVDPNEPSFAAARAWLGERALGWGYAPDDAAYAARLAVADIVVSTAIQEFFGIGVIEAMYRGCLPILPRRLSYPEILPPELHATCLYDDQHDLVTKLVAAIQHLDASTRRDMQAVAARYDWRRLAPLYDNAFERVALGRAA